MNTINILWVDDKFEDENESFTKTVESDISECQDANNSIEVDKVSNLVDFQKNLHSNKKYAAIILDGETAETYKDSPDIKTFGLHLRDIDKLNYKVLKYVYSSYTNQVDKLAMQYDFVVKDKNEISPYDLLSEIKDRIYLEFPIVPELIKCLTDGFISNSNEKYMYHITNSYYDTESDPLEDMRYILEDIFDHLIKIRLINFNALSAQGSLSAKVDYLIKGGDLNGKQIYVPYYVCPIEIRYAIQCLEPCSQLYHHNQSTTWQRMDSSVFGDYEPFFKEMAYQAFFLTIKWYYNFMLNEKKYPSNGNFSNKFKRYY